MNILIAHLPADHAVAESLRSFLDQQGLKAELVPTGEGPHRALPPGTAVVAFWSKDSTFSPDRLAFEKLALDAWSGGRLILVKLDAHFAPVGLRDLPFIDAPFETQRDATAWPEVSRRLRELASRPAAPAAEPMAPAGEIPTKTAMSAPVLMATLLTLGGMGILAWSLLGGSGGRGSGSLLWAVITVGMGLIALIGLLSFRSKRARAPLPTSGPHYRSLKPIAEEPSAIFVSYARVDSPVVTPICEELERHGRRVWVDTAEIDAGESWAGEIVRAIKSVGGVAVMCSQAAIESDHVKREVYLADRYRRKLLPVIIENVDLPDDFEYFFAGVQWLKLHQLPEPERAKAVAKAVAKAMATI